MIYAAVLASLHLDPSSVHHWLGVAIEALTLAVAIGKVLGAHFKKVGDFMTAHGAQMDAIHDRLQGIEDQINPVKKEDKP